LILIDTLQPLTGFLFQWNHLLEMKFLVVSYIYYLLLLLLLLHIYVTTILR
jgi:hypothetical protein